MVSFQSVCVKNGEISLNVLFLPNKNVNAETVILLHGGPGVPDAMTPIAQALSAKYQVVNFEQRGTGDSKNPSRDYSIQGYIDDLDAIAKHFELDQFHLFGHSWGGLYAQIYAEVRPGNIKSMFLSSPSSGTNQLWVQTENEVLSYNKERATPWEFLQMGWYSLLGMFGSDSAYQSLFLLVLNNYHKGFGDIEVDAKLLANVRAVPINLTRPNIVQYKALDRIENPSFPIVITYGVNDIYGPSRTEVSARFPTAKQRTIEKSGHIPWYHNPSAFDEILKEFFSL
jgi:proline iminopeptidase